MRLVALALVTIVLLAPAARASAARPTLTLVGSRPMLVRGSHFRPYEHVRLLINGATFKAVSMEATAAGGFSVAVRVGVDTCGGLIVQAVGSSGSHASTAIRSGGCAIGWPQIPGTGP